MERSRLVQTVLSLFTRKSKTKDPDYRLLPPVVEYRSLVREGLDGFVIEEPVGEEESELFSPPADCALRRLEERRPVPAEEKSPVLSLRRKNADLLEMGDLLQNPQELLFGLQCFLDEEVAAQLAQVEYHPRIALPEAPPSPELVQRALGAGISGRNKERLLVAATVLYRYLAPAMQVRLATALLRLVDIMEIYQACAEATRLENLDLDNIDRVVAAIERAPNRYWQVLTLVQSLRGMVLGVQRCLGAEPAPALARAS